MSQCYYSTFLILNFILQLLLLFTLKQVSIKPITLVMSISINDACLRKHSILFLFHTFKRMLSSERKRKLSFTQINSDSQLISKNKELPGENK